MMILRANYQCVIGGTKQNCVITYNPIADPYAVHFLFVESNAEWIFGRDLMKEALTGPAGEGDVRIRIESDWYIINFTQEGRSVDVYFAAYDMITLTEMLYTVVSEESESNLVDWEQELGKIL